MSRRWQERGVYQPRPVRGMAALLVPETPEVSRGRFNVRDEEPVEAPFNWQQLRRLLGYLRPYRWQVAAAVALMLVTASSRLAVPYLVKLAIDQALDPSGPAALLAPAERLRLDQPVRGGFPGHQRGRACWRPGAASSCRRGWGSRCSTTCGGSCSPTSSGWVSTFTTAGRWARSSSA